MTPAAPTGRPTFLRLATIGPLLGILIAGLLSAASPANAADSRWRFFTADRTHYSSPWYAGKHRIMIPFGCTRAPYYSPDPRCRNDNGFHHGIDVAIPCGTRLKTRIRGWVVRKGDLGPAYGDNPIRIRNFRRGIDIVIGHTRRVAVRPGDYIRPGQRIGRVGDDAAPDGCHLHFEKRRIRGGLETARFGRRLLGLHR